MREKSFECESMNNFLRLCHISKTIDKSRGNTKSVPFRSKWGQGDPR